MRTDTKRLCDLLYGYNYGVFLAGYVVTHSVDASEEEILRLAFGHSVELNATSCMIGDVRARVLKEVSECLEYRGDESSGPIEKNLQSGEFQKLKADLLEEISEWASSSGAILTTWIISGHPAYPVFWEVALLFRSQTTTRIFIGSASD